MVSRRCFHRAWPFALSVGVLVVVLLGSVVPQEPAAAQAAGGAAAGGGSSDLTQGPTTGLEKLGLKFDGAQSCSNAQCHGAANRSATAGATTLAEYSEWRRAGEAHHGAFQSISSDDEEDATPAAKARKESLKKIMAALSIKAADKDARCTSCHTVTVAKPLQGKGYKLNEGVTCAACHGPSEKWLDPHSKKDVVAGWRKEYFGTAGVPQALPPGHAQLLAKTGFYDTKVVRARAERCTSCHLTMDATLAAAGHPQPRFELDTFSRDAKTEGGKYAERHWRPSADPYDGVRLWAIGQAVELRHAMEQLAARTDASVKEPELSDAFFQALAHYLAFRPLLATTTVAGDVAALDTPYRALLKAFPAKDRAGLKASAQALATAVAGVTPAVEQIKPTKATAGTLLQAVAATGVGNQPSRRLMEQQVWSIHALYAPGAAPNDPTLAKIRAAAQSKESPTKATYDAILADLKKAGAIK